MSRAGSAIRATDAALSFFLGTDDISRRAADDQKDRGNDKKIKRSHIRHLQAREQPSLWSPRRASHDFS